MSEIKYKNLTQNLIEAVPEIKEEIDRERSSWGRSRVRNEEPKPKWWKEEDGNWAEYSRTYDSIPHDAFGTILNPYVENLLLVNGREEELERIFSFIEILANHEDEMIREVIKDSFCENLEGWGGEVQKRARKYMGPKTLELAIYNHL